MGNSYNTQLQTKLREVEDLKSDKNTELKKKYNEMRTDILTSILPEIPYQTYLPEKGFCNYDGTEKIHQDVPGCGRICSYASGFQEKEVKDENDSNKIKEKSWSDSSSCWYGYTPLIWERVEGSNNRKIRDIYKNSVPLQENKKKFNSIPHHYRNGLTGHIIAKKFCRNPGDILQIVPGCGAVCSSSKGVGIINVYTHNKNPVGITPWSYWTSNATKYRCDKAQLEKVWKWKDDNASIKELVMSAISPRGSTTCTNDLRSKFTQCREDAERKVGKVYTPESQKIRLYENDDCNRALAACAF